ncbi:hypothetical protein L7F22_061518 [Adiantum nelumboides]|nr:hypothetical protein [Adiantum nelumboides]
MQKRGGSMASIRRGEREEEPALFHEMRRREHERKSSAIHPLPPHDADQPHSAGSANTSLRHQMASSPVKMTLSTASNKGSVDNSVTVDLSGKNDDLLTVELGKNDYDWLLTPPGTPLLNHSELSSALNGESLPQMEPISLVQSLAAIKTSRFSSTQAQTNSRKQGATLPELASRKGQNGVSRSNELPAGSMFSTTNYVATLTPKKTPLTPRSGSVFRPASATKRTPLSSAHTFNPTTPHSKTKPLSAPGSHPTTPTSRDTAAIASKSGGNFFLSASTTKKTCPSSPKGTSSKRLVHSHAQNQPLSAGVSRSSSINKARPQPSRSAPSSRGSSPRGNSHDWQQSFSSKSQSATTPPPLRSTLTTPTSFSTRSSPMGSSHTTRAKTSTKQALFLSSNLLETSMEIPKRGSSTSLTRGKSALVTMDRQSSAGDCVMATTKGGYQIAQARGLLEPLVFPDTTCCGLQAKRALDTYVSPALGLNNRASRRSLDMAIQHSNLCQDTSNGHSSFVASKSVYSPLLSARNVETQKPSSSFFRVSNSITTVDFSKITSCSQDVSVQDEEFMYCSSFKSSADQTDILSPLVKDDFKNSWLDSTDYMNEGPDPMVFFEQGLGKFGSCESPLVCPHGGGAVTCELCSVKMRLQMLNEKSKASFGANSRVFSEA